MNDVITSSGWLKLQKPAGYLYIIKKETYLYIGETSKWPIFRWGSHFSQNGTFTNRIKEYDEEVAKSGAQVDLMAFDLSGIISSHDSVATKRICQAIEHDTHITLGCDQDLARLYTIISDTSRTTPTYIRLPELREYSKEVLRLAKPWLI